MGTEGRRGEVPREGLDEGSDGDVRDGRRGKEEEEERLGDEVDEERRRVEGMEDGEEKDAAMGVLRAKDEALGGGKDGELLKVKALEECCE